MWKLFLALKKSTRIAIVIAGILLLIIFYYAGSTAYYKYQFYKERDKAQNERIKVLLKKVDSLDIVDVKRQKIIKAYSDTINKKEQTINALLERAQNNANRKEGIKKDVTDYPDARLDSLIRNFKYTKPKKYKFK